MTHRAVLLLVVLVTAVSAGRAAAAELKVGALSALRYTAAPGEVNRPVYELVRDTYRPAMLISDPGVPLTPGRGCVGLDAFRAVCLSNSFAFDYVLDLGDGDDVAELPGGATQVRVAAGPGNDRVTLIEAISGRLDGGGGRDELQGGAGDDVLIDGDREGASAGGVDADLLDGGAGAHDLVHYAGRRTALRVDLADGAADGAPGEGDILRGIEDVRGGAGDDVVAGGPESNRIDGGGGTDRLIGRGGDDFFDDLRAGSADCGSGRDVIRGVSRRTAVAPDCERLQRRVAGLEGTDTLTIDAYPAVRGERLVLRLDCADSRAPYGPGCAATARISRADGARRLLAAGEILSGGGRAVPLALTAAGREALSGRERVDATVRIVGPRIGWWSWRIRLGVGSLR